MSKINFHRKIITPWESNSIFSKVASSTSVSAGAPSNLAWPSANLAIYVPFFLQVPAKIQLAFWQNGSTTVSGNIDVGVYGAKGTRLASIGSTAQTPANSGQSAALSVQLGTGLFFMAIAMDNTTGTLAAMSLGSLPLYISSGIFQQASAFPLPATATFAIPTQDYLPKFGLSTRSSL
jgi:hypothetical protein